MNGLDVIFGYGVAGRAIAERLVAAGRPVRIAQRSRPALLPAGAEFFPCDVLDRAAVMEAAAGAARIVIATGFAYDTKVWAECWPRAMAHFLAAAEASAAATLFFDNMYMYGPQDAPIRETTPFAPWGGKPAVRREISEMWQAASSQGRVCMSALRVSDFYGPGVTNSHLGELLFGRLAAGKAAQFAVPLDHPHDVAYLPDVARAAQTLLDAPEDAWGEVWHMPCAETRTLREITTIAAAAMGRPPRIQTVPALLQPVLRLAMPMLREVYDVRFLFDRPYHIDATKFTAHFWSDVTPIEAGVTETARHFQRAAGSQARAA
ncbi:NAD-dependent epimerase/dehydratase family protein [Beijerinckia indica]|uniref:NAD-dependent epimerase/dehydratase n=1 Tax=Beijerinckia indica subsp. indica (strain ATCC 9039 / DSM 1715 / NCIMB 8712) TaxID=395963 RepID=B2IKS8_BEII9|nr:NAD-dependent epimerase/dehydratase family protein [Beijerinckia indica]ACB95117.1 NAD-dependent epimerase/dehydratase [Beijerinckia indica subsp. indica ATCC 9039]